MEPISQLSQTSNFELYLKKGRKIFAKSEIANHPKLSLFSGKINKNESIEESVLKSIEKELGLKIESLQIINKIKS